MRVRRSRPISWTSSVRTRGSGFGEAFPRQRTRTLSRARTWPTCWCRLREQFKQRGEQTPPAEVDAVAALADDQVPARRAGEQPGRHRRTSSRRYDLSGTMFSEFLNQSTDLLPRACFSSSDQLARSHGSASFGGLTPAPAAQARRDPRRGRRPVGLPRAWFVGCELGQPLDAARLGVAPSVPPRSRCASRPGPARAAPDRRRRRRRPGPGRPARLP